MLSENRNIYLFSHRLGSFLFSLRQFPLPCVILVLSFVIVMISVSFFLENLFDIITSVSTIISEHRFVVLGFAQRANFSNNKNMALPTPTPKKKLERRSQPSIPCRDRSHDITKLVLY